jgi:hypothetical protein
LDWAEVNPRNRDLFQPFLLLSWTARSDHSKERVGLVAGPFPLAFFFGLKIFSRFFCAFDVVVAAADVVVIVVAAAAVVDIIVVVVVAAAAAAAAVAVADDVLFFVFCRLTRKPVAKLQSLQFRRPVQVSLPVRSIRMCI